MRDYQKTKVYQAENVLQAMYDMASSTAANTIVLRGMTLQLEPEVRFGDIASVQAYVDRVTALRDGVKLSVRERKGDKMAHYQAGVIAVHSGRNNWGMRELVILHEIAHHYAADHVSHGPGFAQTYVELIADAMGPQAALAMRMVYDMEGVDVGKGKAA